MRRRIKRRKKRRIVLIFVELSNAKFQNGIQIDGIFAYEYFKIRPYFCFRKKLIKFEIKSHNDPIIKERKSRRLPIIFKLQYIKKRSHRMV